MEDQGVDGGGDDSTEHGHDESEGEDDFCDVLHDFLFSSRRLRVSSQDWLPRRSPYAQSADFAGQLSQIGLYAITLSDLQFCESYRTSCS